MFRPLHRRSLPRRPLHLHQNHQHPQRFPYSTQKQQQPPPSSSPQSRITRLNARLPKFLHRYTTPLSAAPLTHITSFLLLHELTAVIPLLGLAATFHYTHWLPSWFAEGAWVLQGVERFGRYFRRKGWIRSEDAKEAEAEVREGQVSAGETGGGLRRRDKAWNISEGGVRLVVEFATAYAVTKALLPLRIILSVWATPWFARVAVVPGLNLVKRVFGRGKKAGTTGGDALPKK